MAPTKRKSKQQLIRIVPPQPSKNLPIRSTWIQDQGWCMWLKDDPQSVSAMLRGRGDGREKLYHRYVQYWKRRNPALSEETLHAGYEEYALYMEQQMDREMQQQTQQAQQIRHRNPFAVLLGHTSGQSPSRMHILFRINPRWIGIALVAVLAYGAAHYG